MNGLDLRARQNLTFWGADWKTREIAAHQISLREFDLEVAKRDVMSKTVMLYAKILRLDREKQVLLKHRGVLADLESVAAHKRAVGRFSTLDLMEVQSERALLEPALTDLEKDLSAALVEFKTVVGSGALFDLSTTLEEMTARAIRSPEPVFVGHADLRKAELEEAQTELERGVIFSKHLPTVSLFANYGRQAFTVPDLVSSYATAWSFGLELTIPLFSGLSSLGESRASAARTRIQELHKREVRDGLSEQQVRTRESYLSAVRGLESRAKAFDLAEKAQKEGARGYRDGRYDFLRYFKLEENRLRAETELARANETLVRAFIDRGVAYGIGAREIAALGEGS